jgi:hypothetical protein
MVAVLTSFTILLTMVLGSLAYAGASTRASRYQQDVDLALAAAESGLNDLTSHLRLDPSYLDNVADKADDAGGYCKHGAVGNSTSVSEAGARDYFTDSCNWGSLSGPRWKRIGNDTSRTQQQYHITILHYYALPGAVDVVSTGRSGNTYRSLRAKISLDTTPLYLYFSDYELGDPTDVNNYPNPTNTYTGAALTSEECGGLWPGDSPALGYAWQNLDNTTANNIPPRRYTYQGMVRPCLQASFGSWDKLKGRIHSNDLIRANGAMFNGPFTTANPLCTANGGVLNKDDCIEGTANWMTTEVSYSGHKEMPGIGDTKQAAADGIGCSYQGATRIILGRPNANQMTVWSPWTTTTSPGCGQLPDLALESGAVVDMPTDPNDALVFVGSLDSGAAEPLTAGSLGGLDGRKLPLGTYDGSALSVTSNYTIEAAVDQERKMNTYGNVYVEGEFSGQLTVAAEENIIITGDLVAKDRATDLLGLIASGAVEVMNPVLREYKGVEVPGGGVQKSVGTNLKDLAAGWPSEYFGGPLVLRVEAAIQAQSGGFRLQNWQLGGKRGTLQVFGSIAQEFRGVVGVEDTNHVLQAGYEKTYEYNPLLTEGQPLLFSPVSGASWNTWWVEKYNTPEATKK